MERVLDIEEVEPVAELRDVRELPLPVEILSGRAVPVPSLVRIVERAGRKVDPDTNLPPGFVRDLPRNLRSKLDGFFVGHARAPPPLVAPPDGVGESPRQLIANHGMNIEVELDCFPHRLGIEGDDEYLLDAGRLLAGVLPSTDHIPQRVREGVAARVYETTEGNSVGPRGSVGGRDADGVGG